MQNASTTRFPAGPRIATAVLMMLLACAGTASASVADEQRWRFQVLLDEREIGFHDFVVTQEDDSARVETVAEFDVRILFINAYRYRHRNVEQWEGGCLASIQSRTDANGEHLRVDGAPSGASFRLELQQGGETLESSCVRTFAYWNPAALMADRLLNSQTGEWVDVEVQELGGSTVRYAGLELPARRLRILLPEGQVDLWYHRDTGDWLALESPTEGGRMLRYVPVELPGLRLERQLSQN